MAGTQIFAKQLDILLWGLNILLPWKHSFTSMQNNKAKAKTKQTKKNPNFYIPFISISMPHINQWASLVAQKVKNLPATQETRVWFLGQEDPLEKGISHYPLQGSCLENAMDKGAWQAIYSPWGHKESDTAERLTHTYKPI